MPSNPAPLGDVAHLDQFGVHNRYYAPQVGVSVGVRLARLSVRAACKVGLGLLDVDAKAEGTTTRRQTDGTLTQLGGGVLAPVPGTATTSESFFAVIPELAVSADYAVTDWCRLRVGYDVLFVSRIVRAGGLVGGVRSSQVPQLSSFDSTSSSTGPAPSLRDEGFWAQGLAVGLEIRY